MGARSSAAINPLLTNYAQGLAQDLRSAQAQYISPVVPVSASLGRYKQFDDKNAFQLYNTARALGGPATRIQFSETDPSYDCQPNALEVSIDDAEYDAAGDQSGQLDESRIRVLLTSAMLSQEEKVSALAKTITAVSGVGVWSVATNDPVAEINAQIEALATATGMMPNRILFGLGSWRVFRDHPLVLKRFPGAAIIGVTNSQAAALLLNPAIQIQVGTLSKDTTKFGSAKNATNIIGAEVFIFMASDSPSQYDPSAMKTFMGGRGGITAVRTYRDEKARSTVHAIDWSQDIKITGSSCIKRISIS